MKKKPTVAVGLSGGVDSSVSAVLLKEKGYQVIGFFLHFWNEKVKGSCRENICCSLEAQEDARAVAQKLGIPFYTLNLKAKFKEKVVEPFLQDYAEGKTPNPCVNCNNFIKFGEFLHKAKVLGADFLATGHYAKIKKVKNNGKVSQKLLIPKDKKKDQTYFLHGLKSKQLEKIIFPLANLNKDEVREIARNYGLKTAIKKESQEVCFVHDGLEDFLGRNLKLNQGSIVDRSTGDILGNHKGLALFTIGQRKGLGLSGGPWFVVGFDYNKNIVFVSRQEKDLLVEDFKIKNVNWINGFPEKQSNLKCCVRYHGNLVCCKVEKSGQVKLNKPLRAVTAGQFCVFYQGNNCLGGGVIQ